MKRPVLHPLLVAASLVIAAAALPATAAQVRGPAVDSPAAGGASGEVTSAGDPFLPDRGRTGSIAPVIETYAMSCGIGDGTFANGASIIKLVNTGSKPIPAGATVEVVFPDGSTKKFKTPSEIKPGGSVGIMGPVGATADTFACSAFASRQVPATATGAPKSSKGPQALPTLPPKLTCSFEIIDGKVVVFWKNEGGTTIPAGTKITGKTSSGIGITSFIADPIPPGGSVSVVLDIDPQYFAEACVATVTY